MAETKLKTQALDVSTRLQSKIVSVTRDLTVASGDVGITGVGFTPTAIIAISCIQSALQFGVGMVDSSRTSRELFSYGADLIYNDTAFVQIASSAGNTQQATLKSYDSDGFTLTWTKAGSPTGTGQIMFLCFK